MVWKYHWVQIIVIYLLIPGCTPDERYYSPVESNVSYSQVEKLTHDMPGIRHQYGSDPLQYAFLWLPPEHIARPDNGFPVVVFIHGGCWLNAYDIKHSHALGTALSRQGYAVWSVEYRRTGDVGGGWPGSFEDILASIGYLANLENDRVDISRTILSGHSAGGHLALLAGGRLRDIGKKQHAAPNVVGVVGMAAITNIETYASGNNSCQQATPKFMGGSPQEKPEAYLSANPVRQSLHKNSILLHGGQDTIVPLDDAKESRLPLRQVNNAGHFDWVHPGTEAFKLYIDVINEMVGL